MKTYHVIGYAKEKPEDDWQLIKKDLIVNLTEDANPYLLIQEQWKNFFSHWLVSFIEME